MRIGAIPETPLEWIALHTNRMPVPLVHTQIYFVFSRAVLEAFSLNVFEAFAKGEKTLQQAARSTGLNSRALKSLLNILISAGYISFSKNKYALTPLARKWCLQDSPESLYNQQLFNGVCWEWMDHLHTFLQTGKGLQFHETFSPREWKLYQNGMENVASGSAKAAIRMLPKLNKPQQMLDIGGSHGIYCVELLKKYPDVKATIFELPDAIPAARKILKKHYEGKDIRYRAGNILTDELEEESYDLILVSSLMHHFTEQQNQVVCRKVSKALKKGGYFVIQEFLRPETANKMDMIGSVLDLYFNLSSTSGNWSKEELIRFQKKAGLEHLHTRGFVASPGYTQVVAVKR
jgi:ubiquinone/menaquinone biosynthesis C-methylase UbiE